ncbi:MAG TPA: hypothetical protein VGP92_08810 [Acidimicrobiia bacterium]|jgi:hypothetical protein|nr:hypothetical protein [Acidimicrobiia bacterium]
MRRLFFVLALAVAVGAPAGAAFAQSYQIDSLSTTTPTPGQTIHVHGNGFAPSSSVGVIQTCGSTKSTIGSLTASSNDGTVDGDVALPATAPTGTCTISLLGTNPDGSPRSLDFSVTVAAAQTAAAAATSSGSSLPFTGAMVGPMIAAAVGLVLVGASLVASVRRRRRALV